MPITVVAAEPIEGQVRRDIAIVSSLGEHVVGNYVLVRIADEAGHIGLGEASVTSVWSGETQAGCIAIIREVLAPLVVGADPFDSEWISRRLEKAAFANSFARAALEMALLDLHDAGGPDLSEHIRRSLRWMERAPEIDRTLIDEQAQVIWRKVARREPRKLVRSLRAVAARIHPSLRLGLLDTLCPPTEVDWESRPYHLGWVLHTWLGQLS